MRLLSLCVVALLLAGCASMDIGGTSAGTSSPRPKTIVVSDLVFASEVTAVDRGYTARLERKIGTFPTFERKQRTLERVNDEILASIVVTLREAGLEAQTGSEEGLSLNDDMVVVNGRLHASGQAKPNQIGFGAGHGGVVAELTLSHLSSGGKKQLASFTAESARKPAAVPASRNAAIVAAATAAGSPAERLSPDVEAPARALGRAVGEKIVALAREQGWLENAAKGGAEEKPARLPRSKTSQAKPKTPAEPNED
ncbi:MAG: hypothetical protein HY244_00370 [Rhizobiales bacterium]|nr:hypothetical protein [Hyphomicrobiales bacterium]